MSEKQEQGSGSGPPTGGHPMSVERSTVEDLFTPFERLLDHWEARPQLKGASRDGQELTAVSVTNRLNKLFLTAIDTPSAENLETVLDKELEGLEEIRHELGRIREHLFREQGTLKEGGIEIVGYLRLLDKLKGHIYRKIVARFALAVQRAREPGAV